MIDMYHVGYSTICRNFVTGTKMIFLKLDKNVDDRKDLFAMFVMMNGEVKRITFAARSEFTQCFYDYFEITK